MIPDSNIWKRSSSSQQISYSYSEHFTGMVIVAIKFPSCNMILKTGSSERLNEENEGLWIKKIDENTLNSRKINLILDGEKPDCLLEALKIMIKFKYFGQLIWRHEFGDDSNAWGNFFFYKHLH